LPAAGTDQDKAAYFPLSNLPHAVLRRCILSASQQGWSMRLGITYAGRYEECTSGPRSWGGPGHFAGQANQCRAGDFSFGFGQGFTGFATNCSAGIGSFGSGALGPSAGFHGLAKGCQAGDDSFGGSGWMMDCDVAGAINAAIPTTGRLEDCRIGPAPGNRAAIVIGTGATLYNCTLVANPSGAGFSIDAPKPVTARVAHCRMNHGMRNVENAIEEPYNVDDPDLD
jgi:hypothetical protein